MSVRTDTINLNVNINGNKAQNDLNNLKKKAADIKLEMEGLNKKTQEYGEKKKELAEVTAQMTALKQQIGIASLSQKELIAELNKLKALKGSVVPFSNEFKDLDAQIKQVESRLYDVKNGVQGFSSFFSKIKDEVKQFGALAAGYLGFQFITSSFQNIIQGAAKTSDQLADLRKSIGFSEEEVRKFNQELSKIDTRTSVAALRDIAKVGGQLGIAKQDILGFTVAVDKLNVALGDEFTGGAEEITNVVGKLRNTFSDIRSDKIDQDLLHIGNALNVLGAAGIATGPVVSDFAQRIGAAGQVYGLTAGQTFGLSAALQEMGVTAERGSTAVVKILQKLSSSPELFLDVARSVDPAIKSLDQFKGIINSDISRAFTLVAQGFAKSKGSATDFAEKLSDATVSGAAITEVLAKVGQNSGIVADKIKLASSALKETSSIQQEFNIKNENFAATLDKLGKELLGIAAKFTGFAQASVNGLVSFINVLKDIPRFVSENRTAFIALTGVILTYVAAKTKATQSAIANRLATLLETAADKLEAAQKFISAAATRAYATAKAILTGKIQLATIAQQAFNIVARANPLAIILGLLTAVATAFSFFASGVKKATEAEQNHADVLAEVKNQTEATKSQIETLTKVITSSTASTEEKAKALEKLKSISHEYLDGLTQENITQQEGINIIKTYIKSLDALADAKARVNLKAKLKEQLLESQNASSGLEVEKAGKQDIGGVKKFLFGADGKLFGIGDRNKFDVEKDMEKENENQQKIADRLKALDTDNDRQIEAYRKSIADKQNQLKGLQKDSDQAKKIARDIASDQKVLFTLTGLDDGATNIPGATGGGTNDPNAGSVAALRKKLQAQLDALKEAYEKLDALNVKGRQKNLAEQKQLQDELSRLDGKETKGDKSANSEYKQLKKEAEKFYQDLLLLKKKSQIEGEEPEQKEIDAVKNKFEELTRKAKEFYLKGVVDKKRFNDEETLLESAKQEEIDAIFKKYLQKRIDAGNQKEYEESLLASQKYFDDQRTLAANNFAANKLSQQEYDAELKKLDRQELADRVTISNDYSKSVKKAAEDVTAFKKQQEQKTTADLIEETKKRKEAQDQDKLAVAQRGVITSKGKGVDAEVQAKKNLLQVQFDLDTQYLDKKSELYQTKEAELQDAIAQTDREGLEKKIDNVMQYVGFFQSALDSVNQILSNSENRQLAKEKKTNDEKKKDLKKQLDGKLISQAQYDKKTQDLDEQQQKRENEVKRKQAIREKAINIFNAVVNNAAAILKTMASVPFPLNIPLAIAQGIAGGLQIAAIKNAPLPELGVGDWIRSGDKHKDPSRGIPVMIERDEAVMSAAAMTDKDVLTVTGTTAQITAALNARRGGTNWAGGAAVQMPKWRTERPAQINPGLVRYMATGGLGSGKTDASGNGSAMDETNGLLKQLIQKQDENTAEIRTMKTKLHAVVSIKEYREEEARYDAAKKASGIAS